MSWMSLALLIAATGLVVPGDKPAAKQHEYRAEKLPSVFRPPAGAKADWRPVAKVKANDSISFIYPFAKKDLDLFECSSDNIDVRLSIGEDEKGLRVSINTGETGKGKKATAKVAWRVIEVNGHEHRWSMDVVFE